MKQLAMKSAENHSFSMLFSCFKNHKVNEDMQLKRNVLFGIAKNPTTASAPQ
jgi:hypothetical protein